MAVKLIRQARCLPGSGFQCDLMHALVIHVTKIVVNAYGRGRQKL